MKYINFSFKNYKGINDLSFDFNAESKKPYCIIGNNESGKTTILKGIELISKLCEGKSLVNGNRQAICPKGDGDYEVILEATLKLETFLLEADIFKKHIEENKDKYCKVHLKFIYNFSNSSFKNEDIVLYINDIEVKEEFEEVTIDPMNTAITATTISKQSTPFKEIAKLIRDYAPDVIYYDDFQFVVPSKLRFLKCNNTINTDNAFLKSRNNQFWQKIFNDVLKGSSEGKVTSFQDDIVDWGLEEDNIKSASSDRLRGMGKYLDKMLEDWIKKYKTIDNIVITPLDSFTEEDKPFNDYEIKVYSRDNSYDMSERSKGLQWSFCFHILTKIRQNRHNAGFIFLLDEPANNLHIRPQKEMLSNLNSLCNDKNLLVYSTHSPELILDIKKNDDMKNIFIAKNNSQEFQKTSIRLYELNEENLKKIIDIQDIEPILAKESFKLIRPEGEKNKNEKTQWLKNISIVKEKLLSDKTGKAINIGNFLMNLTRFLPPS